MPTFPESVKIIQYYSFLFIRLVSKVPDCPGEPPSCPYLGAETEKRAAQRLQLALLDTRKSFRSFAQPKV